jgi:endonuclease/exonuclease/phosphatase (EEP) superfamily protein YafD
MKDARTMTIPKRDRPRLTLWQRLWKLLLAAFDVYAALLILYLPLRALFGDQLGPVALLNTFLHWALLPAFALLPVMLWVRRWPTAAMLGVNVAVFLWLFGGLFLPPPPAPADSCGLTVMTYNLGDSLAVPNVMVSVLRSSEADIIALQELADEQAAAIERDLRDLYPYQVLYGHGVHGKGLLSRYPILEEELFYLQSQRLPYLRTTLQVPLCPSTLRQGSGQALLRTSSGQALATDGAGPSSQTTPVTVIVAHPPPPSLRRGGYHIHPQAAAEIVSIAQMTTASGPGILVGDFNLTDQNDNYNLLSDAGLTDAFRAAGWGFGATWPTRSRIGLLRLFVRIDYIWHSAHFRAVHAWVGPDAGSDHLPVLARLAWQTKMQD